MSLILKNKSDGYNYKYASLCDLVEQGIEIPKMTTRLIDGDEYVFYQDNNEWLQGARVVIPQSKGMNEAQCYGSALSYARRYTLLLAFGIATQDDEQIEIHKATEKQINYLKKLYSVENQKAMIDHYQVESLNDLPADIVSKYIEEATKKKEERWEGLEEKKEGNK